MTGPIKDMEKLNNIQLENLKRRQYRTIKTLEEAHQNHKAELKKTQESEIIDLQGENHRQLAEEANKKERVLSDMRHHLHTTQELTDKQLRDLRQNTQKQKNDLREKLGADREKVITESQLYMEELNDKFQNETRKINHEGKIRASDMARQMNEQYSEQQGHLQKKINDQAMEFTARFNREAMEHKKIKDQVDNQNKLERISTNKRQQLEMSKLTESHNKVIETRGTEFRKGLKEQDVFFQDKYLKNHASHSKDANSLDERYNNLMNKMKIDLAREMTKTENRLDDPFYHFTELRPSLKHTEDGVEIKVSIPEYSKQDIQITTNSKEAILSFNRRYNDTNKSSDGGVLNKVDKVETFTSRINTGVILNPKTVKSSYEDGVMTYTIKRV